MATEIPSFAAAALKIAAATAAMEKVQEETLEQIGLMVYKTAYAKFGVYQQAVGPYAAWAPLAESTKERRIAAGTTADQPLYRPGMPMADGAHLRDTVSFDVQSWRSTVTIGSTSDIMLENEVGQENLPPRPVLGPALWENKNQIHTLVGRNYMTALIAAFGGRRYLGLNLASRYNFPSVSFGGLRASDSVQGVPF